MNIKQIVTSDTVESTAFHMLAGGLALLAAELASIFIGGFLAQLLLYGCFAIHVCIFHFVVRSLRPSFFLAVGYVIASILVRVIM